MPMNHCTSIADQHSFIVAKRNFSQIHGILELKIHRAEILALAQRTTNCLFDAFIPLTHPSHSSSIEIHPTATSKTNQANHLPIHTNPTSDPQNPPTPTRLDNRINNPLPHPQPTATLAKEPRTATTICATHNPAMLSQPRRKYPRTSRLADQTTVSDFPHFG